MVHIFCRGFKIRHLVLLSVQNMRLISECLFHYGPSGTYFYDSQYFFKNGNEGRCE